MYLVKSLSQFNENSIFFCEPIKNNIVNDALFIKILYSTKNIVFNGIYLKFNLFVTNIENSFNKNIIFFNTKNNEELVNNLKKLEENLLVKYNISKQPYYKISSQLKNGELKLFNKNYINFEINNPNNKNSNNNNPNNNNSNNNNPNNNNSNNINPNNNNSNNINITNINNFNNSNLELILKISGLWENENNYGLTFKFICPSLYY